MTVNRRIIDTAKLGKISGGTVICVVAVVVILFFVFDYQLSHNSKKSEECVDFCLFFDNGLTSGLEKLIQGAPETIIVIENKLKADIIVLCKSYSDVSSSKLKEYGISDRTAKKIDVPYLTEGVYFYLLKDSRILCEGHTVYADLISNEIIAKLGDKISFTLMPNPNIHNLQEAWGEAETKAVPIESIRYTMVITDVK